MRTNPNERDGQTVERLRRLAMFEACSDAALDRVARSTTEIDIGPGHVLIEEGGPGDRCYVIVSGLARVSLGGQTLGILGPGDVVGEIAVLDGGTRTATVVADTAMSLLAFDRAGFELVAASVPSLRRRVTAALVRRLRSAEGAPLSVR